MLHSSIHMCCSCSFRMVRTAGAEQKQTGHQEQSGAQVFILALSRAIRDMLRHGHCQAQSAELKEENTLKQIRKGLVGPTCLVFPSRAEGSSEELSSGIRIQAKSLNSVSKRTSGNLTYQSVLSISPAWRHPCPQTITLRVAGSELQPPVFLSGWAELLFSHKLLSAATSEMHQSG